MCQREHRRVMFGIRETSLSLLKIRMHWQGAGLNILQIRKRAGFWYWPQAAHPHTYPRAPHQWVCKVSLMLSEAV